MNTNSILLSIQGDFVDSFIYTGTLFLVHSNSQLSTYSWNNILDFATNQIHEINLKRQVRTFMGDCRSWQFDFENNDRISIDIDHETLKGMELSRIYLDKWPSDINIYSNSLYVCSEDGVDEYEFDYETNKVSDNPPLKIWDEYAFMVAPNDFHRLAIAAGKNGVIAAFPKKNSIDSKDLLILIEQPSSDCEWIGRNLVSNTSEGSYLSVFSSLSPKPQNPDQEYWDLFNREKRSAKTHLIRSQEQSTLKYAWLAGEKLFGINGKGEVYSHLETLNGNSQFEKRDIPRLSQERLLGARSGSFGTVIEYENNLILYNESGEDLISHHPVNWRVFPRAKNYVNHLHVVENDRLQIYAYEIKQSHNHLDYFAIDTKNII
jgi:hypothetical protein